MHEQPCGPPAIAGAQPQFVFGSVESRNITGFGPWKDFVNENFPWLEHRPLSRDRFDASVNAFRFPDCALSVIRAGASEVVRTRQLAQAAPDGFIKLMWQTAGGLCIEQDRRDCSIGPGEVTVCDTARPYRIRLSAGAAFVVAMLPYHAIPGWDGAGQRVCATRLADGGIARAAIGALLAIAGMPADVLAAEGDTVVTSVRWMLSSVLTRSGRAPAVARLAPEDRFRRAQRLVLERIADPDLSVNDLATALCMSRRALYLMFEQHHTTPSRMIRDIRLERSAESLHSPACRTRKITDIAFDFGFSDYATFSRLFKQRFGLTPREHRDRETARCAPARRTPWSVPDAVAIRP